MRITLDILLSPEYLHKNIREWILKKASETHKNRTVKDIGYIIDICSLEKIETLMIHKNTNEVIVKGTYEADIFYPEKGKIVEGCKVYMIFVHGIFIKYYTMDILIPAKYLDDYTFNEDTTSFIHKKNKTIISPGSSINIEITDIRYSEHEFSCLAKIS